MILSTDHGHIDENDKDTPVPSTVTGTRRDIVTAMLSTWLVGGVLADGWAHEHVKLESFITPWHAVLYAGFMAVAGWVAWVGLHTAAPVPGARTPFVFPAGYSLAAVGAIVFWLSGIADLAWHTAFGIERGDAALLSPSHLGLLCGGVLLTTTPIRSAWHRHHGQRPLPFTALWSAALTTFTLSFLLHEDNPFWDNPISKGHRDAVRAATYPSSGYIQHISLGAAVGSIIITTLVLFVPLIAIATRWRITVLTCAFVLGFPAVAIGAIKGFNDTGLALLGIVAGLLAGIAIELSRRLPVASRLTIGAVAFWSTYVGGVALGDHGLGVKAEIWAGLIIWPALVTLAIALLALDRRDMPNNRTDTGPQEH